MKDIKKSVGDEQRKENEINENILNSIKNFAHTLKKVS